MDKSARAETMRHVTYPKHVFWIALLLGLTPWFFSATHRANPNPASRFATAEALVHDGRFSIDGCVFRSIDSVKINGRT